MKEVTNMPIPKYDFAIEYFEDHIYILGGKDSEENVLNDVH